MGFNWTNWTNSMPGPAFYNSFGGFNPLALQANGLGPKGMQLLQNSGYKLNDIFNNQHFGSVGAEGNSIFNPDSDLGQTWQKAMGADTSIFDSVAPWFQLGSSVWGAIEGLREFNKTYGLQRDQFNLQRDQFEDNKQRYWQKWERQNEARNDAMM